MKSNITIGVTTVAFSKDQQLVSKLKEQGFGEIKINEAGKRFKEDELIDFLSDCDAAIVGLDKIHEGILSQVPNLKVISKYGVGLDNIDLQACKAAKVEVLHTQGVNKRSVSEMALGFMISLSRNLYKTSNQLKQGTWNKSGGFQISGKTIGIIGIGHIGKDLVELLQPFGCRILANDIIDQNDYYQEKGLIAASKEKIYEEADIITIHTPLTAETKNLFSKASFDQMKSSAIVINTARGGIFDQEDLKVALKTGNIGAAAIDAYEIEPPKDQDLLDIPNLMNTPHIGGNSREAVLAMGESSISNLLGFYS